MAYIPTNKFGGITLHAGNISVKLAPYGTENAFKALAKTFNLKADIKIYRRRYENTMAVLEWNNTRSNYSLTEEEQQSMKVRAMREQQIFRMVCAVFCIILAGVVSYLSEPASLQTTVQIPMQVAAK